jgi:hypothetical protein
MCLSLSKKKIMCTFRTVRENLLEEPYSFKLITSIPGR